MSSPKCSFKMEWPNLDAGCMALVENGTCNNRVAITTHGTTYCIEIACPRTDCKGLREDGFCANDGRECPNWDSDDPYNDCWDTIENGHGLLGRMFG